MSDRRVWVASILNGHIDDPMHTTPCGADLASSGSNDDVMITIVKRKTKGMIKKGVDCIYVKYIEIMVRTQIKETV